MRVFVAGANGFIGNALVRGILENTDWCVTAIDIEVDRLPDEWVGHHRFELLQGDMTAESEWVDRQIQRADVVVPLAAVAVPKIYIENPLQVFRLDFLANLPFIDLAAQYKKRLVFPSSSEVYGKCEDAAFCEETSPFVLGPVKNHRWIYSSAKQLLDRVIHAHGLQSGLDYTLFRPFNWIGAKLDRIDPHGVGNSRVITQFISSILYDRPITLVDGGSQRRCFLYLDDAIDALIRIIRNENNVASKRIFNIGNPDSDLSIRELAEGLLQAYAEHPRSKEHPFTAGLQEVSSREFYGEGFEDVSVRRPAVKLAKDLLGWEPKTAAQDAIAMTLDAFLDDFEKQNAGSVLRTFTATK